MTRKYDIGPAGKIASAEPKSVAHPVQGAANGKLGRGIARADARHHGAAFRIDLVNRSHGTPVPEASNAATTRSSPLVSLAVPCYSEANLSNAGPKAAIPRKIYEQARNRPESAGGDCSRVGAPLTRSSRRGVTRRGE